MVADVCGGWASEKKDNCNILVVFLLVNCNNIMLI